MKLASAVLLALVASACATAEFNPDASTADFDGTAAASDGGTADAPCIPSEVSPRIFEATGQIEMFAVPECVESITIEAFGAQGGNSTGGATGGLGARIRGTYEVQPGDTLTIGVGVQGASGVPFATTNGQGGGTGGGGTFVVFGAMPLVVAGGGGGASSNDNPQVNLAINGGDAVLTEDGQPGDGDGAGAGGINGGGGTTGNNTGGFHVGTAGGGLERGGTGTSDGNTGSFGTVNQPGQGFEEGAAGGIGGSQGRPGGFGGGGAAGFTGGGGGGYSGGGTASIFGAYGGGGGGSYNRGTDRDEEAGVQTGDGQVILSW